MNDRKPAVTSAVLVMLGACLVLWLSGCSSATPDTEGHSSAVSTTADPALVADVRQAVDATKALTSVHLSVRTNGQVDSMLGITNADVDVRANPLAAKGCAPTRPGGRPVPDKGRHHLGETVRRLDQTRLRVRPGGLPPGRPRQRCGEVADGVTNLQSQGTEVIDGVTPTRSPEPSRPRRSRSSIQAPGSRGRRPCGLPRTVRTAWCGPMSTSGSGSVQITLSKWNEPVNVD